MTDGFLQEFDIHTIIPILDEIDEFELAAQWDGMEDGMRDKRAGRRRRF